MLATEQILKQLQAAYTKLVIKQITNDSIGVIDVALDCNIKLANSLIKIYPWLYNTDLEEWRDQIIKVCDCELPCLDCGTVVFDPTTMKWIARNFECEDLEGKWIAYSQSVECEDNGITTTLPVTSTLPFPTITTTQSTGECWGPIHIYRYKSAPGPESIEAKYIDCTGLEKTIIFTKGQAYCITYRFRSNGRVWIASDPANDQYLTTNGFSAGVYPCGTILE